jgi:DNA invertase Pin-like site-specific DNA recombinase
VVVVVKLDRLSRSLADLLNIVERIGKAGAGFRSLGENLDTTSSAGRAMMQMVGVFAEFERSIIRERTKAGLAEARKAGRKLGRRFKLSEADRQQIVYLVREGKMTAADCARTYHIHESNISRLLAAAKAKD